ncbi:putative NRPS-like enzyme [Xylaria cf. heliscus]|nr:putative NRPS-like enzyme [Xylaria cf. heliscus]
MANEHERVARWQNDLLPHVVDRLAHERPDAQYGEWVTASGVVKINYAQLANIINGLAWWLVEQLGGPGDYGSHPEVLAYIGPNDVRYSALVLATLKAGYVLFVTSPRNSPAAHRALFEHLQCRTLITSDPVPAPAYGVLEAVKPPRHLLAPSVDHLLTKQHSPYILNKTVEEVQQSPFVIMHTSGSTGLPKPIIWTHDTCAQVLNSKSRETPGAISSVDGSLVNGKRVIVTLPPFHGALLAHLMVGAIPYGNVVIAPAVAPIPTAQGVVDALKQTRADVAVLIPSIVAELAQNPGLLEYCAAHLETIIYIGGDLPKDIGDRVAAKVYLRCQWGATETGIVPQLLPQELLPMDPRGRTSWQYIQFHPCIGAVFDEVTDGTYELVIRRNKALAQTQACFTVPGLDQLETEYRTKDLFEPHPDIANLWRWRARVDDIIVFLNGEKTNPTSMEQHIIASNPELSGALVIGAQRFQAALLIEPASDRELSTAEEAALIERIWPSVEEANRSAPAHAHVEKSFILVVPSDRRLIRAAKGTFMRGGSISQYTKEIERLYDNADTVPEDDDVEGDEATMHVAGIDGVTRLVRQHVRSVTGLSKLEDTENFFERGMDSLQGLQLMRALRRGFRRHDFALSTIYQKPTVAQLATAIFEGNDSGQNELEAMKTLFATYSKYIQQIPVPKDTREDSRNSSGRVDVLLTGSTGKIGTYLLHALLKRGDIGHIFCLNRANDGGSSSIRKSFESGQLAINALDDKDRVTFLKVDFQHPLLGLDDSTYERLRTHVGLIIHAAWPVNFNLALSSFRPQLTGLVNLLTLAAAATPQTSSSAARFVFISSVAAVERYAHGPAPEEVLHGFETPAPFGYGRAKFLAELLVESAAQHFGKSVGTSVIRVGQVAGPVHSPGLWDPREWFPSMVLSSLHLGQIPDSLGSRFSDIDFVPIDVLADVLADLATATTEGEIPGKATVFNVRNAHLAPWRDLLRTITDAATATTTRDSVLTPLHVVTPAAWLAALRESSQTDGNYEDVTLGNPAVKLIDFFDGLWTTESRTTVVDNAQEHMAVDCALAASATLRELGSVRSEWMRKWFNEWVTR